MISNIRRVPRIPINLVVILTAFAVSTSYAQQTENHKNLIEKARNLTLQRDRLQASQVLQRALQKEPKASPAFKEMSRALDELMLLFYTEKGQSLFTQADAAIDSNPKAAIDSYNAALRAEDGNVSVLMALARAHLRLEECAKAEAFIKQAESMNPYSPEVKLLRLQALSCTGSFDQLSQQLSQLNDANMSELSSVEKYLKTFQIQEAIRKKDFKKAKSIQSAWEIANAEYPEVYFWKYKLSSIEGGNSDRSAGAKYVQLCQTMSVRKKKTYNLDVELCRSREKIEEELKTLPQDAVPAEENDDD